MRGGRPLIVAGGLALCVALALTAGWPDLGRSIDLLSGRTVTPATESAFLVLLCWLAASVIALALLSTYRAPHRVRTKASPIRSLALVVIGVALLGAGIARHGGYRVCCATATTAQQAEQLVH